MLLKNAAITYMRTLDQRRWTAIIRLRTDDAHRIVLAMLTKKVEQ